MFDLDTTILASIETLIAESKAIQTELDRVKASRRPSKAGVGVFAAFVVPSGYKRLARQVGSLWLDSSYESQLKRLEGVGEAWRERVHGFLGTVRVSPSDRHRGMTIRQLQTSFAKTQRYDRLDSRLRNGVGFLAAMKTRQVVPGEAPIAPDVPPEAETRQVRHQTRTTPVKTLFPPSVIEKLPEPVKRSIEQAVESYHREMYEPAAVMLRKAVQNGIVLRFEAEGVGTEVLQASGDALPLPKLIEKAQHARLVSSQQAKELMRVKWLGDTAAHSYANQITREDIDGVVVIVRLALERIFTIQIRPAVERRDETL